jgi:hypothetical protein
MVLLSPALFVKFTFEKLCVHHTSNFGTYQAPDAKTPHRQPPSFEPGANPV